MKEDITKLPVWAQRKIEWLGDEIKYWKEKLKQFDSPDASIFWECGDLGLEMKNGHGLPDKSRIKFKLPMGVLELCIDDGLIRVVNYENPSFYLYVSPAVTNVLYIGLKKERK